MLTDTVRQFNWFDILIVILLIRICYVSAKNGFPIELFKFLGTVFAIYTALHYYTILSDVVRERYSVENMPLEFLDFVVFLALAVTTYLFFVIVRSVFYRLIRMEAAKSLDKWGGLILGIFRGFLVAGLITFMLAISSVDYFKKSINNSYSAGKLFNIAPDTYAWLWNNIASKFMTGDKFNKTVLEVQGNFHRE